MTPRARHAWTHTTRPRRALDLTFEVQTTDAELGRFLDEVFAVFQAPTPDAKAVRFGLAESADAAARGARFAVRRAHRTISATDHPSMAFDELFAAINRATVRASREQVLVHSGLVGLGGNAVMLVGVSGAGKSSLTGMLCAQGATYGTDELVAVDPTTGIVTGARRPIMLKPSAPRALVDRLPPKPPGVRRYLDLVRPVALADLGTTPMDATPGPVGVVLVRYAHGVPAASLTAISRADAVAALVASCWHRRTRGRVVFDTLVELARGAEVAALEFSDCTRAAEVVREQFGDG